MGAIFMEALVQQKLRHEGLRNKIVSAEEAASFIQDGMALGMSGFTRAGDVKAIPAALAARAKEGHFQVDVYTGASTGPEIDHLMAEANIVRRRGPYQGAAAMRKRVNDGSVLYADAHLSHTPELVRQKIYGPLHFAIIEACAITEDGYLIPTTSLGNSPIYAQEAQEILIELNVAHTNALEGIHDVYVPKNWGNREPIPLTKADDRIGTIGIPLDVDKVRGIVITNIPDVPSPMTPSDAETDQMAQNLIDFLRSEIKAGRFTEDLPPLQAGVGAVANAVLRGFKDSEFTDLQLYSEVMQDSMFELMDAGKVKVACGASITLSDDMSDTVFSNFERYADKLILRPQEISNNPELIRRLGLIAINTALEVDIYGNVNSTHVCGTKMMNGIGGSGDFARNARLGIFVTKSAAKNGDISSVVPMVSHHDHTEHDVDVIVTEQGVADLRGLSPKERVAVMIDKCAHPDYKEQLWQYYREACEVAGDHHLPHDLEKAFSWHTRLLKTGSMKEKVNVQ